MKLRALLALAVCGVAACEREPSVGRSRAPLVSVYGPDAGLFGGAVAGFRGGYLVGDPGRGVVYREPLRSPVVLAGPGQYGAAMDCLADGGCTHQNGTTGAIVTPFGFFLGRAQPSRTLAMLQTGADQLAVAVGFPDDCVLPPCPGEVEYYRLTLDGGSRVAIAGDAGFGKDVALGFVQGASSVLLGVTSERGAPKVVNLVTLGSLPLPVTANGASIRFGVFDFGSGVMVGDPATSRAIGLRLDGGSVFTIAKVIDCGDSGVGLEMAVFDFDGDNRSDVALSRLGAVAVALSSNQYACELLPPVPGLNESAFGFSLSSYESASGPRLLVGSPLAEVGSNVAVGAVHEFELCDVPSQASSLFCRAVGLDASVIFGDGGADGGDGGADGGLPSDAGADGGMVTDAGLPTDAGGLDGGSVEDAGADGGATSDAGSVDGGLLDAGVATDAGGALDAGSVDGGGEADGGRADGGVALVFVPACAVVEPGWLAGAPVLFLFALRRRGRRC